MQADGRAPLRFLVIEDERSIGELVKLHLEDLDATVRVVGDGCEGLRQALSHEWDLIVLDLRLPAISGLDICRELRLRGGNTRVLMLTARAAEMDRVLGLETGADDYLVKPFSPVELVARCKALLRRTIRCTPDRTAGPTHVRNGAIEVDRRRHRVYVHGREVDLTAREFDLLWFLACHPGQVFGRAELLDAVWGYGHDGYEHTVNSHINRLRAKIEAAPAQPEYLQTVRGVGYRFREVP